MGDRGIQDMLKTSLACRLHQQQLIEVLLLALAGLWLLSRLFSFSVLMSTAGLLPRMSKSFKSFASAVNVRHGQPCDDSTTFRNEVREYVIDNHHRLRKLRAKGRKPTRGEWVQSQALAQSDNEDDTPAGQGYKQLMKTVNEFFDVWNGRWWIIVACEHNSPGPQCCPKGRATTVQRMRASGQELLFYCGVTRLAANK